MLLVAPDRVVSVDSLVEAVWNSRPPATGRTQVAICVSGLRKMFRAAGCSDTVIATVAPGYQLLSENHTIDATEFTRRLARSRELAGSRETARQAETAEAVDEYTRALDLWRGPALSGISAHVLEAEAARLDEQRRTAIEERSALRLDLGHHRSLISDLTGLVHEQPLREQTRAQLMLAQYRSGHRLEALETFRQGRQQFIDEFGLEPGPVLQELHNSILRDDPSLELTRTEAQGPASTVAPAQLPSDVSAFVGRERELVALDGLLRDQGDDQPLAVGFITGGAGIGKTGLAMHWAHQVVTHYVDGQLYADLHGYDSGIEPTDASMILDQFLRALGAPAENIPVELSERVALYRSMLDGRRVLVVLDNARTYSQIRGLLPGCGQCCVLVTSRNSLPELLEGHGARVLRLPPLTVDESVALLADLVGDRRVTDDRASSENLAELCDRLPLALRIMAARLISKPHWTVRRLMARLQDRRRRLDELTHGERGVRSCLQLSYRTLEPDAAMMYRRLGLVDVSSIDVQVGAALLNTSPDDAEDVLEQLVDAQLLDVVDTGANGDVRYRLSQLRWLYAKERALQDESMPERIAAHVRVVEDRVPFAAASDEPAPLAAIRGAPAAVRSIPCAPPSFDAAAG